MSSADQPTQSPPGTELELTIDAVAFGGKGVARYGPPPGPGKVFFVEGAIEGERVRARVTEDSGRYADAEILEVLTPSPLRGVSACRFATECGGCQWMGVAYDRQLAWKQQFVVSALGRIGKLAPDVPIQILGSPALLGYRNRILVRVHKHAQGIEFGYFARGTRRLVPIDRCAIADARLNETLAEFAALELGDLPDLKFRLELQALPPQGTAKGHTALTIYPAEGPRDAIDELVKRVAGLSTVHWAGLVFALSDAPLVTFDEDLGLKFQTLPGQFQQVNVAHNHTLRRMVKDYVDATASKRILDVFCGSGNLSLPLAGPGRYVEGVESNKKAIVVARHNAEAAGLSASVCYLAGDAEKHLWKCARGGEVFDLVILDPPRQGMYKGMVPLKKLEPKHIIYVSCDPTTLARDLGYLCRNDDYKITSVTALDFFPNTYHVESVVTLVRQNR